MLEAGLKSPLFFRRAGLLMYISWGEMFSFTPISSMRFLLRGYFIIINLVGGRTCSTGEEFLSKLWNCSIYYYSSSFVSLFLI